MNYGLVFGPREFGQGQAERKRNYGGITEGDSSDCQDINLPPHPPPACCTETTVPPTVKTHTCQTLLALILNARMINKTVS